MVSAISSAPDLASSTLTVLVLIIVMTLMIYIYIMMKRYPLDLYLGPKIPPARPCRLFAGFGLVMMVITMMISMMMIQPREYGPGLGILNS